MDLSKKLYQWFVVRVRLASIYAPMVAITFGIGLSSCSSTSGDSVRSIEAIEDEKDPLKDSDCLEGEYYDKGTESCELLENQGGADTSHEGNIDVPKQDGTEN